MPKRDITLPPIHNKRSPEQWRIVSKHINFDGKTVLDLGCGYGDLLLRAAMANARRVVGVDKMISNIDQKHFSLVSHSFYSADIDLHVESSFPNFDIALCFSVLPYLSYPEAALRWMYKHSTQTLIECQLAGDGPGFDWLKTPDDLRRWLESIGWKSVERIGETVVKDRNAKRGIWLCQKQ